MQVIEYVSEATQVCDAPRVVDTIRTPQQNLQFQGLFRWHAAKGSTLFRSGEPRQLYFIETGALCHYTQPTKGRPSIIEFVFPGEIIGLGCLAEHVSTARTMADSYVRVITDADLERALANDDRLFFRMAEASDREFDYLRNRALKAKSRSPIERVANFLLAIAGINASEGRDPLIVTGNVSSGHVAERLDMSIDTLADALLSLRQGGLIDVSDHVLRIRNIAGLESMTANGPAQSCQREAVRQFSR